jgi:hypothetical protein
MHKLKAGNGTSVKCFKSATVSFVWCDHLSSFGTIWVAMAME